MHVRTRRDAERSGGDGGWGADLKTRTPHNFVGKNRVSVQMANPDSPFFAKASWVTIFFERAF